MYIYIYVCIHVCLHIYYFYLNQDFHPFHEHQGHFGNRGYHSIALRPDSALQVPSPDDVAVWWPDRRVSEGHEPKRSSHWGWTASEWCRQ